LYVLLATLLATYQEIHQASITTSIALHGSWWWLWQILCLSSFTLYQYKLLATVLYSSTS
jgi:hypothetical protein